MKIAVVSDDQEKVGAHFGRSRYYIVFTVENGEIVSRELREKAGHRHGAGHGAGHGDASGHGHDHGHDHHQGEHHHHGHHHEPGRPADRAHMQMVEAIRDCEVVLVGGMGGGARAAMDAAGISPCHAEARDATEAVAAFLRQGRSREPGCPDTG